MTWRLFGVLAALALTTGCSETSAGLPRPAPPPPSPTATQLAPPVAEPRDVRAFGETPCEVFTPEQIAAFGLAPETRRQTLPSGHEVCIWEDGGDNIGLAVTTYPDSDILEREYANRRGYPVFEPIEILGMPAILRENIPNGSRCVVVVGLAHMQGIGIDFSDQTEPFEDPCGGARTAAEVAVGNLPPLT